MSGSADRLPRLLSLVPYLQAHPGAKVADVAEVFGVTEKQLRSDLDLVFLCGLPGHGPGDLIDVSYDGDTVSVTNADTIARPLRLTTQEALALIVAPADACRAARRRRRGVGPAGPGQARVGDRHGSRRRGQDRGAGRGR